MQGDVHVPDHPSSTARVRFRPESLRRGCLVSPGLSGDRDRVRWVVPFGAAGVPDPPHHDDQLPLWLRGRTAPYVRAGRRPRQ
ncbi:penicillin acylase family protein [Streptomyces guryensis]|uniref:penicillin acylase family protein n=1 Tax=Streptomyces guryensis TaxID=2886947 RepID=UPI0035568641